ncbi:unnamed protein product [Cunninghamella blakesleeana]
MTKSRLTQQRFTFWDTAPFYEGRPEIWQALQAAMNSDDLALSQSILDAANIKLPTGNPADGCYDELGTKYVIPVYCIVDPTNLIDDDTDSIERRYSEDIQQVPPSTLMQQDFRKHKKTMSSTSSMSIPHSPTSFIHGEYRLSRSISNTLNPYSASQNNLNTLAPISSSSSTLSIVTTLITGDFPVTIRLSTGQDIPLKIHTDDETVPMLKTRIYKDERANISPDTHSIKLIYLGKILDDRTDILSDSSTKLNKNAVRLRSDAVIQALIVEKGD